MSMRKLGVASLGTLLVLTAGCRVEHHAKGGVDGEDVKIATPFGGVDVKTDDAAVQAKVGLAAYPGAVLESKHGDGDHDSGAADVSLSFGNFHLGVKALSYRTSDTPDKLVAFYRKDMARYGMVVLCKDNHAVGTPTRTQDGLGCTHESGKEIDMEGESRQGELKAGSRQHQHLVTIDRDGSGTKFALVALDLPAHMGDDDQSE